MAKLRLFRVSVMLDRSNEMRLLARTHRRYETAALFTLPLSGLPNVLTTSSSCWRWLHSRFTWEFTEAVEDDGSA